MKLEEQSTENLEKLKKKCEDILNTRKKKKGWVDKVADNIDWGSFE